ncbi:hypothetical protein NLI96_g731 [Meripilus lineatus]|uniref:Uncharacterized protein n=1 Tax=Meripilus lineatus TaxID=2056292 RepID=A0AAD5VEA6_9APHY|nr:hypothetical protein NLI96_g731 [Physisporinus lineatus]
MSYLYASGLNISFPASPSMQTHPFTTSDMDHKCPCCQRCVVGNLSRLSYTPPTPPRKSFIPTTMLKVRKPRETKQSRKVTAMRIRRLDDGRRIPLQWMLDAGLPPFDLLLVSLEEAQQREDIVYRGFYHPHPPPPSQL